MSDKPDISRWRLDKRVPMALILALFLQLAAAIIWATQLDARVNTLEQKTTGIASFGEKIARIEERLKSMKEDTESIKHGLDQLINRLLR